MRRRATLWNGVQTGAAGASARANFGAATNVTLFIEVNGATTITIEASPGSIAPGRNDDGSPATAWFALFKDDFTAPFSFVFAGAGEAALDLSPFAAESIRLVSSNDVLATAFATSV
jgi:hypothetical protein